MRSLLCGLRFWGIVDEPTCAASTQHRKGGARGAPTLSPILKCHLLLSKALACLADLAALEVAELLREALQRGRNCRERKDEVSVVQARDDLRWTMGGRW
jgi:hypothetical protein